MTDYISREDVYRFAKDQRVKETGAFSKGYNKALLDIMSAARNNEAIPSADVSEVRHGKWIENYEPYNTGEECVGVQYGYECSICGRWEYKKEPFCNCGAEMEV